MPVPVPTAGGRPHQPCCGRPTHTRGQESRVDRTRRRRGGPRTTLPRGCDLNGQAVHAVYAGALLLKRQMVVRTDLLKESLDGINQLGRS